MSINTQQLKTEIPVDQYYSGYLGEPESDNRNHKVYFCPFHNDNNTPNFTVYPDGGYKCYACEESGDVISFHEHQTGLPFSAAIKDLASKYAPHLLTKIKPYKEERMIVAEYDYQNKDEEVVFQVVRYQPKDFRQRRPDGKDGWIWNLKGVDPILYRLPELISHSGPIYICEGEKDADLLWSKGIPATTCPMGAGRWKNSFNEYLEGNDAIILPDNDDVGVKHGHAIAQSLQGTAKSIKVVRLSGLDEHGDVSDYLSSHTIEDLHGEVDECDYFDPSTALKSLKTLKSDWEEIEKFSSGHPPEIKADVLPGVFGDFAKSLAAATEVPEGLTVFGVLGTVSATISHRFSVSPKQGWEEPTNLYLLAALPPGNNKSSILKACSYPLVQWEKEQAEKLGPEIKQAISERKTTEEIINKLRKDASRQTDHDLRKFEIHEVTQMEAELQDPPVLPQIFVTDATPESLALNTHEQKGRFAIITDEGGIIEIVSGLYTRGQANINILLNGIDGGPVRIRRKEQSYDLNPYLTLCLFVQPIIIQSMGSKKAFSGKGLLERFLYLLPKSPLGYRTHDTQPVSASLQSDYNRSVTVMLDKYMAIGSDKPRQILILGEPCREEWRKFQDQLEVQLRPSGKLHPIAGWAGKICGFALRLAGLLHVMEHDDRSIEISKQTMGRALKLANVLISHSLTAFDLMAVDEATKKAQSVLEWVKANGETTFSRNKCHKALNGQFKNVGELTEALDILKEQNIINGPETIRPEGKGRPSIVYTVNPALFSDVN